MEDSIAKVLSPFFLFLQLFAASTACSEKYSSVEYIEIQLGSPSYYVAKCDIFLIMHDVHSWRIELLYLIMCKYDEKYGKK